MHAAEGVRATPHLDVGFEAQDPAAVLGAQGRARQPAHAGTDDDYVVLAGCAGHAVAGAGVRWLLVRRLEGHVVREGHDLVAGRVLDLLDVLVLVVVVVVVALLLDVDVDVGR